MRIILRILFVVCLFLLFQPELSAQKKEKSKSSSKSKASIQLADKYFNNFEFFLAVQEYGKVLEKEPENKYAVFQMAESYRHFFHYDKAEEYYKKIIDMDAQDDYPLAHFWYAMMLKLNGKYEEALENLQVFIDDPKATGGEINKEKAKVELEGCKLALLEMKVPQKDYAFENLPTPANGVHSDYSPVIYENDTSIVIASARKESKGGDEFSWLGGYFSDNFRFVKTDKGWEQMHDRDIFSGLHTELNESPGSFSGDKTKFYFTRCDESVKTGNVVEYFCAVYISEHKDNKWQKPVKLNENINMKGQWNAQPHVNAGDDTLYFVSKRPGGYGMHDIWMSTSTGKDDWGTPVNLGPKINTPYIDMSPCFYPQENALFFASNGHEGFGGLDIFIAKGKNFSEVKNAGLPFNSNRDDFYFTMGEKKGYLSSNRDGGKGNDDIYEFNLKGKECVVAIIDHKDLEDAKSISVVGTVKFKYTNLPASDVEISMQDWDGLLLKKTFTDESGLFRFSNLSPEDYKILLEDFDPRLTFEVQYVVDDVHVKKSDQVATRKLFENIYFDFDKYNLRPEAKKVLDELAAYYKANPDIQIEMNANTDAFGSSAYNIALSKSRGKASLDYLIAKGVKKSALVINAKGKDVPIATNNNPGGRQLNRRVEFYIIGGPGYEARAMAYVIEPKITLYSIAKKFNMSVEELKQLNGLEDEKILAFRPLRVRRTGDEDIIAPATLMFVETTKIVNDPRLSERQTENSEKPKAKHPEKKNEKAVPAEEKKVKSDIDYHVVQPAHTLYSISHMYGMTVDDLKELNGLTSNKLRVGQRLKVVKGDHLKGDANTMYVVKNGDTMSSIAKQFGLTAEDLKALNNLDSYVLYENMVLKVRK